MSNELTIFEGQELEILTKEDVNFEFEGTVLLNGIQCVSILGYTNQNRDIERHCEEEDIYIITKEKLSTEMVLKLKLNTYELTLGQRGTKFINEDGVFDLIYNSKLPNAKQFKKKVKSIISQIQRTGKFDSTENNIMLIEDETERNYEIAIYNLKQTLDANPNDMLMQFAYKTKVTDLATYKQSRELKLLQGKIEGLESDVSGVKKDTELIKGQQMFVCNRTNFNDKIKILANKYYGREISKAYNALFAKMKQLGSFDVYARCKNEWDKINEDRVADGKEPYAKSTLRGKVNYLDIINKHDKWELCSEAYKTIETEEYTANTAK